MQKAGQNSVRDRPEHSSVLIAMIVKGNDHLLAVIQCLTVCYEYCRAEQHP